jgi:2,5-dihydroxypyridine 5,6-dioxygenase
MPSCRGFDHWGAGHVHTFPNEQSANGTVVLAPGDIVVLPYCRYVQDEVRLDIRDGFIHASRAVSTPS